MNIIGLACILRIVITGLAVAIEDEGVVLHERLSDRCSDTCQCAICKGFLSIDI